MLKTVLGTVLVAAFLGAAAGVCHEMNARFNARFEDHQRRLQALRAAHLEVHEADRNLNEVGRSDPAALHAFEQAVDSLRRAEALAKADRFPRRPRPTASEAD